MRIQDLEHIFVKSFYMDVGDQLKRHVYDRSEKAFAAGDAERDAIQNTEALQARQSYMHARFIECLGGLPPSDTPLNPRLVGTVECDGFKIEKIIFESRPDTYVTTNLYIPDGITSPRGAVLFVCGHHERAKHTDEYQIVCRYLVKAGLVVMALDPIGQGERLSYYEKSIGQATVEYCVAEHDYAGTPTWMLGDGTARYFVHDAMRGIDYLTTRPEVDPAKIGITGNSGGGTQSSLMMVCDPRIAAAAPATFIMNRHTFMLTGSGQDAEQIWPGMTACGFDHEDILLMMAPKPVRVIGVTSDFFPIEGTRRTVERCKRIWEVLGKGDLLDLVLDDSTHKYTRPLAKAAAEFFSLHLLGRKVTPVDSEIEPVEPSKLWCTVSGQVRGDYENARAIYEENVDRLTRLEEERNAIPEKERMERAMSWLRERVFTHRKPCDLNPRYYAGDALQIYDFTVTPCFWFSQEDIVNHGLLFRNFRFVNQHLPVTVALWNDGTQSIRPHLDWIRETCNSGRAVLILDVTGMSGLLPNQLNGCDPKEFYGSVFKLTLDLMWLDDSLAAMRIYDTLRALDLIEMWPGLKSDDIRFYAHGRHGVYARFAEPLDERIKGVEVVEGMTSYADWIRSRYYDAYDIMGIVLPGMLRYFDLSDLNSQ